MRPLLALLILVAATACGADDPAASPPATTADAQVRPASPAPTLEIAGPPPAWIETESGSLWLAYATFCWAGCADYRAPVCGDERRAPTIVVRRSEVVRFHLGFEPEGGVALRFFRGRKDVREIHLPSNRTPTWEVERGGPFWIDAAKTGTGSASYSGCLKLAVA